MNLILIVTGLVVNFIEDASFHFNGGSQLRHNPKRKDHWAILLGIGKFQSFTELLVRAFFMATLIQSIGWRYPILIN